MAGNDTLLHKIDSGWVDDDELVDAPSASQHDSILSKKKNIFLDGMTKLIIDTVHPGDGRRDFFKKVSSYMFRNYFNKMGYSDGQILRLHSAFWQYYDDKDIFMIALQDPNPPGAESASAYDPTTRKVIPFYSP
ncbi:MAG TPA: hypothetical protein VLX91_02270 [Candidatus Acidoferrales bacterium]|nr:hypothetical protein [Candidatus Acidoferrales bacterium]